MTASERQAPAERIERWIDWIYPPRCRGCGGWIAGPDSQYFCGSCWLQIQLVTHPLCPLCGRPFLDAAGEDHFCGACLARMPRFLGARAWACYPREETAEHPLRKAVQKFKYGRKVSLGKPLGRLMARGCRTFLNDHPLNMIVPVPLHPKRLRWRGFNQSVLLGREVSRAYHLPMNPFILVRHRETAPQTQLSEEERRKNVHGVFSVRNPEPVRRQRILLVDDVYTSGATLNECSRVLLRAGASEVYVLTLARTVS